MFNIYTLNSIADEGIELLNDQYKVVDSADSDAILVRSSSMHEMELTENVKAIARAGAGVNNIPLDKCAEKGVVVFNTPGANANGVKELVIAGLLLASRDIIGGVKWAETLKGTEGVEKAVEKGKAAYVGPELLGKKIGIVGLGAIGVLVANACKSMGMKVYGYDPFISIEAAWGLSREVKRCEKLEELFSEVDYLTIHVPLNAKTKYLINGDNLSQLKDGIRILNFSRAELVDELALKDGLLSGKVAKYVSDFPNEQTMELPNTICIPHLGASTPESEINCAIMAVNQVMDYLENGNIKNSVNYPECSMGVCKTAGRITILHKNVPGIISQITQVLSTQAVNIADMINKSKDKFAYTMIDIDEKVDVKVIEALSNIEDVLKVRLF